MTIAADDRFEILDVIARYNRAADDKDVEGTVALYTPDGFISGDFKAGPGESFGAELSAIFAMEQTLKRHVSVNPIFEHSGDGVAVHSLLVVVEGERAPAVGATARIHDEFVRYQGEWRLRSHKVTIDPSLRAMLPRP